MAAINRLPHEIVSQIIEDLASDDLFRLRQTCKDLNAKTFTYFLRRYFQTRCVMLEQHSLETLVLISEHPVIGPYIRTLVISTDHLLPVHDLWGVTPPSKPTMATWVSFYPGEWTENSDEEWSKDDDSTDEDGAPWNFLTRRTPSRLHQLNDRGYSQSWLSQEEMIRKGSATTSLTKAMKRLSGCKEVAVVDEKKPWGLKRLRRKIGVNPQRCLVNEVDSSVRFISRLLESVHASLINSQIQIEMFTIWLGSRIDEANRISADMLAKPTSTPLDSAQVTSVKELSLLLDPYKYDPLPDSANWEEDVAQFVDRFPNVSRFSLEFEDHDSYSKFPCKTEPGFQDFTQHSRFAKLSAILYLPNLKILELTNLDCRCMEFGFFLLRHSSTIRDVRIYGINLVDERRGWSWLINILRKNLQITNFSFDRCQAMGRDILDGELYQVVDDNGFREIIEMLDEEESNEESNEENKV